MSDVVIIGAGPAGLTLGCYLAQVGIGSLILDKAHHPRPHVGESLMPGTVRILNEIGFTPILEASDFPRSGGVVYHPAAGRSVPISYGEFPQEGVDQDYTYHVDRSKFDVLLLKYAESLGCRIVEGVTVQGATLDEGGAVTGVRVALGSQSVEIPAKLVVDAGGRTTRLGRQLEIRRDNPLLEHFALHAWFLGVARGKRRTEGYTHIYFLPELGGWAWQAAISPEITSIGVVSEKRAYQSSPLDIEEFFLDAFRYNPSLAKATAKAQLLDDITGDANYSYRLERVCGDGWLAVGDAAQFVDPVFSSGVSVAMHTARFAAERIQAAVESGDFSRSTFLPYEEHVLSGAATWEEFVQLFYRLLPAFTHLLQQKEHRGSMLRLIQGDIHGAARAGALDAMRSLVSEVEQSASHPWRGALVELRGR